MGNLVMPAKPNRKQYHFYLTDEQAAVFEAALSASGADKSAYIRDALAAKVGAAWPDNMPQLRENFSTRNRRR